MTQASWKTSDLWRDVNSADWLRNTEKLQVRALEVDDKYTA